MKTSVFWEDRYRSGAAQKYPWSQVVSFVMRHRDKSQLPEETKIVEIGCGTGSNLWFAAREGFQVSGYDVSASAIEYARSRFKQDELSGDFYVADFAAMDLGEATTHILIDRGALTCVNLPNIHAVFEKIRIALKPGGLFLFTPYSATGFSARDQPLPKDRFHINIEKGGSVGYGGLSFLTKDDVFALFDEGWSLESVVLNRQDDVLNGIDHWHDEWQVIARKNGS